MLVAVRPTQGLATATRPRNVWANPQVQEPLHLLYSHARCPPNNRYGIVVPRVPSVGNQCGQHVRTPVPTHGLTFCLYPCPQQLVHCGRNRHDERMHGVQQGHFGKVKRLGLGPAGAPSPYTSHGDLRQIQSVFHCILWLGVTPSHMGDEKCFSKVMPLRVSVLTLAHTTLPQWWPCCSWGVQCWWSWA